ncbi:MAG: helix-turn-helix domain-containing protein [Alphaproteobacteria bacterium]|nr:helix-turn-helix domain-containing protein [Alphaproteobacteria bacterium]HJP23453.1 helix-turn-helix domain-containing protein [Alphaproteobacteria bacterium]
MTTKDESHTSGDLGIERVKQIRNPALVQERRTQILDAALELFIEKGYHRTTIRDICARSGINQASLYDYVQNKDDILRRLLYRMHHPERPESNGEPCDPASLASFEAYLIYLFEFAWTENHKAIQLTYRTAGDMARDDLGEVLDRDAALVDRVAKGIDHFYDLKADDDRVAVIANVIVFLTAFLPLRGWNLHQFDTAYLAKTLARLVTDMIGTLKTGAESEAQVQRRA